MAHLKLILCVISLAVFHADSSKLNVPRVLLPLFSDVATNFTLEVTDGGCYKWTMSREDVIQLTPLNVQPGTHCSTQVVLSAITKEKKRSTVVVFAEEVRSRQIIPCDVDVDVINSLQIVTRTRELYVEEAPQRFEVSAYDDQGNQFTTLQGIEVDWAVSSVGTSGIVSFMTFKESPYDTPPSVAHFDQIGIRGHIILLEGIKTGTAKVSVKFPQKEYAHINPVEVQLMVVANLLIDPADVYLLPGDTIKYRVLQIRHGRLHEIEMPSEQYYFEMEDKKIASIDSYSSEAQGLQVGRTKVFLRDRNLSGARDPQATINVALPAFLHLVLLPHRHWSILVNDEHVITVEVFDRSNHKFNINGGRVDISVPSQLFHVESTCLNGTYSAGWAVKPGTAPVHAVLKGVVSPRGTEYPLKDKVSTEADMLIYPRMEIQPNKVVLPWDPRIRSRYQVPLTCKGGDGAFIWSSANTSVATVSAVGLVHTATLGQATITAVMLNNPHNQATASVSVLPPTQLQILDGGLEAEIGAPINLHIAVFSKQIPFTMCHELPLTVTISDENFVRQDSPEGPVVDGACTVVTLLGKSFGNAKVTVTYREGDLLLEDSIMVAAFRPLTVLDPASAETVLALGTSRQIVFVGGPRPTGRGRGSSVEHGKTMTDASQGDTKSKKDILEITELPNLSSDIRDRYVYTVLCRVLGDTLATLTVFSEGRSGQRIESSASVKVFCAKPRFATLRAVLKTDEHSSCPMNVNAERVAVQSSRDLQLELEVTDVHGRLFDNITSIHMEWSANPNTLSQFANKDGAFSDTIKENGLTLPFRYYQIVQPFGETGAVDVFVRLTGYKSAVLRPKQITPEWPPFAIKGEKGPVTPDLRASLSLLFVSDTLVTPNQTTLFNHPSSHLTLHVSQGSGYFEPQLESQDVASVRYLEHSQTLEVRPISTGVTRFGLVDLCLPSRPAIVSITVVGIHSVVVDVADYLERGKQTVCSVHILDTQGHPLELLDLRQLELRPQLEGSSSSIISVKECANGDCDIGKPLGVYGPPSPGEFRFIVQGLTLGDASLYFTTGYGTFEVRSPTVSIQVFDPLRLHPRNMTLLVGSEMSVGVSGGPVQGLQLEYSVSRPGFVEVSDLGIIEGVKVGYTRLTGRAIGVSKVSGNKIIFSEDSIDVYVVPLNGIRIESPLTRLKVNTVMPVWANGLPDPLSPLVLGTTRPALAFQWDLSSREVAEITDVLVNTGMEVTDEQRVSIRVKALSPGRTTLSLSIFAPPAMTGTPEGELYEETVQLEVYEELRLTQPPSIAGKDFSGLLIAPETQMQLRSNRDGLSRVYYSMLGHPTSTNVDSDSNSRDPSIVLTQQNSILSLTNNGLLTSHTSTGRAAIIVSSIDEINVRQTLGLSVEVKPVHYIMTTVKSALRIPLGVSARALPKGLELQLEVTYHDNTGSVFAATRTDISVRASRSDLVQMRRPSDADQLTSNATFYSNLIHSGDTVLQLSDQLTPSQASDFIKLPIEEFIYPPKSKVAVGDLICFSMPLELPTGEMGRWSSDNSQIVSLDDNGVGRARLPGGPVYIKYYLADHVVSSTEIDVVPISSMLFVNDLASPLLSQGAHSEEIYRVGLILNGEGEDSKSSNLIVKDKELSCLQTGPSSFSSLPFTCEARFNSPGISMQISDVFKIQPVFDPVSGRYACEMRPLGLHRSQVSQLRTNVTLRARAASWAGDAASAPLVLPFLPYFHLESEEIVLPGGAPGKLEIKAVPEVIAQLQVVALEDEMVYVSRPQHNSDYSITYQISLTSKFWSNAAVNELQYVNVVSSITNQTVKVAVKLRLDPDQWGAPCIVAPVSSLVDIAYSNRHLLMMVASIIVISLGTLYVYIAFIQPNLRAPATQFLQSGPTLSHSPGMQTFMSPRNNTSPNNITLLRSSPYSDNNPVYGDPQLYYSARQRNLSQDY